MVTDHQPAVEVESLTHCYGDRTALDALSMTVPPRSLFGLLGPNGSGKSTLFKILATVLTPTSGSAKVAGGNVVTERMEVRRHLGIVFQSPSVDDRLTVIENLIHQGHLYGLRGASLRDRAKQLLDRFGLSLRAKDRVQTLSGGLQRRVELAKAVLHRPRVLVLDEPSTGLDPGARADLMQLLLQLRDDEGVTSLLTTHLTEEADACDAVGIVDHGKLAAFETPAALRATIGGDILSVTTDDTTKLVEQVNERFRANAIAVDGTVRIERAAGHQFIPQLIEAFPGSVNSVTLGKPTLADVFLQLTGHMLHDDEKKLEVS